MSIKRITASTASPSPNPLLIALVGLHLGIQPHRQTHLWCHKQKISHGLLQGIHIIHEGHCLLQDLANGKTGQQSLQDRKIRLQVDGEEQANQRVALI